MKYNVKISSLALEDIANLLEYIQVVLNEPQTASRIPALFLRRLTRCRCFRFELRSKQKSRTIHWESESC